EIYHALGFADLWTLLLTLVAIIGNALMFAIGFAVALKPFLGPEMETPKQAHEGPVLLWLGPTTLAVLGAVAALFASTSHLYLSSPMASAVFGRVIEVEISLLPSIGMPLVLSVVTVAIGIVLYRSIDMLRERMAGLLAAIGWGPDRGFDQSVAGIIGLSARAIAVVQNGRMDIYMTATFVVIGVALIAPMVLFDGLPQVPDFPSLRIYEWVVMAIAVIGLAAVIRASDRLTAIVSLGIQGLAVALLFLLFGAPDLAYTQFMVETLSVVILALAMTRLRLAETDRRPAREVLFDLSVALLCGIGLMLALLRVTQTPFDDSLSQFFSEYSRSIAHGRNIVNVILVDFRGLDTLGEIAVVMTAGLAILALIRVRVRRSAPEGKEA
ncbi:MAG TPA: hydrogen gas-evolving membrane-bound hydrogenase subunit E, partial [Paracoccaceae bacterium]|nr:hydrogen gas-evolving membrane-bound hydrogenase subunit E [Paracoccaceae bacterium]